MSEETIFKCEKCEKEFKYEKKYINHKNKEIPCDFVCRKCGKEFSRRSYFRHIKTCNKNPDNKRQITNNDITNNNNNNNNIVSPITNSNNTNTVQNNNNVVMLTPFGLEHNYTMRKTGNLEQIIGPARDLILDLLKKKKYQKAYQVLFEQIHGNSLLPQYHNIYMPRLDSDDICVFKGKRFKFDIIEILMPDMYRYLKVEMRWLVHTALGLDPKEKDQLLWDIQANWMTINEKKDENMKRILRNNKQVVENTLNSKKVWPDVDAIAEYMECEPDQVVTDGVPLRIP